MDYDGTGVGFSHPTGMHSSVEILQTILEYLETKWTLTWVWE